MGLQYNIGPEPEFFIVDIDDEGYPMPYDEAGYFDVEPLDKGPDFRRELTLNLEELDFSRSFSPRSRTWSKRNCI